MAGILGLGSGQASSLNSDLITKLRELDNKTYINPIEKKLENIPKEQELISNINNKISSLYDKVKGLSLNQSSGINVFDSKEATINGDSVKFDVENLQNIKNGTIGVNVEQLAQKDVYQTDKFTNSTENIGGGILNISIGNGKTTSIDTSNKTYEELSKDLNDLGLISSIEKINSSESRLVIKSSNTGLDNKINFSGDTSTLGLDKLENNVLKAQNMNIKVDGISYSNNSNTINANGLNISALKLGESNINIKEDKTSVVKQLEEFTKAYNDLNDLINNELYNKNENIVSDKNRLREIQNSLKNDLFNKSDISIFNIGFSFNEKNGNLVLNSNELSKALDTNKNQIKDLFVGSPEKKGIGTLLDETISIDGITRKMLDYDLKIIENETNLKKERDNSIKNLDNKYKQMEQQFAAYGVIINQMENSFAGLKMLIQQSTKQ